MDKDKINKRLVWLAVVWGAILLAFCLMGCRTKSVVEIVEVHDTLRVLSHDTVTKTVTKTVVNTDSTERYHFIDVNKMMVTNRERTVTLNERGDTTRVNTDTHTWMLQSRRDSVGYYHEMCDSLSELVGIYRARYDSLLAVVSQTKEKEVVKVPWFWAWGWKVIAGIVAIVAIGFIVAIRRK